MQLSPHPWLAVFMVSAVNVVDGALVGTVVAANGKRGWQHGGAYPLSPSGRVRRALPEAGTEPMDLLWDGIDILDADKAKENHYRFGPLESSPLETMFQLEHSIGATPVQILGLQDTGTNLLHAILSTNFGSQVTMITSYNPGDRHGLWKHSFMKWVDRCCKEEFGILHNHGVIPFVMVRNPLSWLQSIKKAPYELENCVARSNWLESDCTHQQPAGPMPNSGVAHFEHLSEIWGQWTESYAPVLGQYFDQVMILKYEDVVQDTEKAVRRIATAMHLQMPGSIDVVQGPAKNHGRAVGHDAAIKKIKNKEYMRAYSTAELSMICKQLMAFQRQLLQYGYDECFSVLNTTEGQDVQPAMYVLTPDSMSDPVIRWVSKHP